MPELPEVEITRRGIAPFVVGEKITGVVVRNSRLRRRVSRGIVRLAPGQKVKDVSRRGKYLLLQCDSGSVILHLGMSGSLRVIDASTPPGKHDHFDLVFGRSALRLRDPRRFGLVLWATHEATKHPLLANLGIEPLDAAFTPEVLHQMTRGSKVAIKQFLMDAKRIVGIGNIYANESLFRAGIRPTLRASRLDGSRCERLVAAVKETLLAALAAGGSSLRDFVHSDGATGYFQQSYYVYDRTSLPCRICGGGIKTVRLGQRSSFYCMHCQK